MRAKHGSTDGHRVQSLSRLHGYVFGALALFLCREAPAQVVRPLPVPGKIEAENYDTNGPGVSYFDTTSGNSGGSYRSDDVDIEPTTDSGGGYDVGWISAGEWLNYTINVQQTAVYQFAFRVAALSSAGSIQASVDGLPLCGVQTPSTGGWQNWQTVTVSNVVLRAGQRMLRIDFTTGGYNLNYIQITKQKDLAGNFLRVSGKQIVDGQGNNVRLHGFGMGNWMIQEPYMMDANGIAATQTELKGKIAALVGTSNMNAFYAAWLSNYISAADIQALSAWGLNSIRLPMHYALFTLPINQEPLPGSNTWVETGFDLVNNVLGWCGSNHIYLILDMHACPGGEGYDQAISDYNPPAPSLWESTTNQNKMIALWREIARRYATNEWIGGYDLINEPNWTFENNPDVHGGSDQTNAPLRQLMMSVTAAIRQVDTNHLLVIEGNGWGNNYNGILPPWDPNLVISFHKYWDDPGSNSFSGRLNMRDQWNMPLWMGESGENSNEWFRDVAHWCDVFNIGWSWWPWKKIATIAGPVMVQEPAGYQTILNYWRNGGTTPPTNIAFNSLLALAQAGRFENCSFHPDVLDALMRPYPEGQTLPFKSNTVPGILFAADYDFGRQGEAYLDMTTTNTYNSGNSYRNDSVDIQPISDSAPSNSFNVGWMDPGDWMKYSVAPVVPGPYAVYARVAGGASGGSFYLDIGGSNTSGTISVPNTGGWQNWTTIPAGILTNTQLTDFKVVVSSAGFNLDWLTLESVPAGNNGLPIGWSDQDLGTPGLPGSAACNSNSGVWAVNGSGSDIWGTSDQGNLVATDLAGDGVIIARVTRLLNTGGHPKVGIMMRSSVSANSPYAFVFVGLNAVSFECRTSVGATSVSVASSSGTTPLWLKLKRTDDGFAASSSPDGYAWTQLGTTNLSLTGSLKAGLAVSANNNSAINTAAFDNVLVTTIPSAQPKLAAASSLAGSQVALSWPVWAAGPQLYAATNLGAQAVWLPVTNVAISDGTNWNVSLSNFGGDRFFRLQN
jgi:hypothetical protein